MSWYLDTSAAVKLVVADVASQGLHTWASQDAVTSVASDLVRTELLRAVRRATPDRLIRAHDVLDACIVVRLPTATFERAALLDEGRILGHPWVTGELALSSLANRSEVLRLLDALPRVFVARPDEIAAFIDRYVLYGQGIGYVDVALLAATALTPDAQLWTGDRRLETAARRLELDVQPDDDPHHG